MIAHDPTQVTVPPWHEALRSLLRDRMGTPFAWGQHDCCLFAADAVLVCTGVDHAADARGRYASALQAARMLEALGGIEAVGARCGPPIAPAFARLGDVGLVDEALAVCTGEVWLVPATDGLAARPLADARLAWRLAHA